MALTITERVKYSAGGRMFCYVSITHDESTSTFTAASVDMTYFENVYNLGMYASSEPADISTLCSHMRATVGADHTTIDMGLPMNAGSKTHYLMIGW